MSSRSATQTYNARLILPGRPDGTARTQLTHRTLRQRVLQGLGAWLGFWILAPLVVFVPPHLPWALAAVILGLYFGVRYWRGEYVVRSFEGACPSCGEPLELKAGSHIRMPYTMDCFHCHRSSTLVLDGDAHG
ncbi:MAG TPA: hypothetical protein VJ957_09485 [Longimicrobiales bacterium]|nr:hypothetical protein [Longimicrobiales bacterium]